MVRAIALAALFLVLAGPLGRAAGFDFTPLESFYEVEGVRMPRWQFHNDGKPLAYTPPAGWKPSGRGKKLTLIPPQTIQAGATFEAVPVGKETLAATAENVRAFRARALALLPQEATKVEVTGAEVSSFKISGRPAVEIYLDYTLSAQNYKMWVLFLPHTEEVLQISVGSHAKDFASLEKTFRRSLFSLQGL
jgi:hypothetical protein